MGFLLVAVVAGFIVFLYMYVLASFSSMSDGRKVTGSLEV